jgi:hypothetical protein
MERVRCGADTCCLLGQTGVPYSSPKMGCVDPMYVSVIGLSGNQWDFLVYDISEGSKRSNNGSRGIAEAGPVVVTGNVFPGNRSVLNLALLRRLFRRMCG